MDVRRATPADAGAIRDVARRSLEVSYSSFLDEQAIDGAIERWYDDDALADLLDDSETLFLVAVVGDEVVGFSQNYVVKGPETVGEIHWLHIDPDHRGHGYADELIEHTRGALEDRGVERLKGLVLDEHDAGNDFYEEHGFEKAYTRRVRIDGGTHVENVYVSLPEDARWQIEIEPRATDGGETVYVAYDEREVGSVGPFYAAYRTGDRDRLYGWFCSNCESFDIAMDAMGRMECNGCGNTRKATRWDAAQG